MFYTKYNKPVRQVVCYDPYDAVDRLTYVDTTIQIARMMQAGVNLAFRANQGFPTVDLDSDSSPCAPVYDVDPALSANMIKNYKEALKNRADELRAGVATEQTTPKTETAEVNASAT